jgi:hypothetical protein
LQQAFVHQKGVSFDVENIVGVFLLIQSKAKLWAASAGSHIDAYGRHFLFLGKVLVEELFGSIGQSEHTNPPECGLEKARKLSVLMSLSESRDPAGFCQAGSNG